MSRSKTTPRPKKSRISDKKAGENFDETLPADEGELIKVVEDTDIEILPPEESRLASEFEEESQDKEQPVSSGKALVRYDALQAYLSEISKFAPLSREEEQEAALKYYSNKEREAAYKLISSNLWLVVKIAKEYEKAARSLLDLIQEGNIGLMEAVGNFDPYRGVRFPSYAVWWIRAYIIRYLMANWRMVKIGTTQAQRKLFFNLKKEKERLEREGFFPAPKLLADRLNVKEQEVIEMEQRLGSSDLSVDAPVSSDGDTTLLSLMPSEQESAEEIVAAKQAQKLLKIKLEQFKTSLNDKEKLIFESRLLAEEKATLQDIAVQLSLSKERIRQIEERIKLRLKEYLSNQFGDSIDSTEFFK
mgnify:CR=1 FL=1